MRIVLTILLLTSLVGIISLNISCNTERKIPQKEVKVSVHQSRLQTPPTQKKIDKSPAPVQEVKVSVDQSRLQTPPTQKKIDKSPAPVQEVTGEGEVKKTKQPQTKDLLSNNPINKNIYVDYMGKRIYFCCRNSMKQFNDSPAKFIKLAQEKGIILEDSP